MPQIFDFLSSDLGVTPHQTSTGSLRGGDCGAFPSTAACGEGGEGAREDPQFQLRPSDSPLQVRGPQSRKLVSSWRPAQEELRVPTALVPVPALPRPGWVTRARE